MTQLSNFPYKVYVFCNTFHCRIYQIQSFWNSSTGFFSSQRISCTRQINGRFASLAAGYGLGSYGGFGYSACSASALESELTSAFGSPGYADPIYQQFLSYLNKFKTACSCEKAAIAFGVIGWYRVPYAWLRSRLLWTCTLLLVGYELWKLYHGGRSHNVPPPTEDVKMHHVPSSGQEIIYPDQSLP